jgi:hypothetical protein
MAIIDYSDMAEDIQNSQDPIILPKGSEVKVRIIQVRTGTSEKTDQDYFSPVFEVLGDGNEMVKELSDFHWILDPEKLDKKTFERSKNQFRKFATCFGLDLSRPFDVEDDLIGLEGWIIVGVKKSDEYGDQNTVSSYVLPR